MSNAGKYRCHGARKVMSSIKSMPRYAVVPKKDESLKVAQGSPREELLSRRVSSIQDGPSGS